MPRKKPLFVCAVLGAFVVGSLLAANLFPDQTWYIMNNARDLVKAAFFPSSEPVVLAPASTPTPYLDPDAYEVISAWKHKRFHGDVIVVRTEVQRDHHEAPGQSCVPTNLRFTFSRAMNDLEVNWHRIGFFENRFNPPEQFVLIPKAELPEAARRFPRRSEASAGHFEFSYIGFNAAHTRAVLHVVHWDGRLGYSNDIFMQRDANRTWTVVALSDCGWIT